ncbi:MAG: DUF4344 domain-containing metallopeptidase [Paracoccaceae bacterium]
MIERTLAALAGSLALALAAPPPAPAQTAPSGDGLGVMRVIFFHELGHALIDEFDLPTVGPEEHVVDEFATYMLILTEPGDRRQIEALSAALSFWIASSERFNGTRYGEHPPNDRRGYAIACLLYGSDPDGFRELIRELDIPQSRASRCEVEYREKREKWLRLLGPHLRREGADGAALGVAYAPAREGSAEATASLWRQARFLEGLASEASALFALDRAIPVVGRECGFPNAFWDGERITMCYEMQQAVESALAGPEEQDAPIATRSVSVGFGDGPAADGAEDARDDAGAPPPAAATGGSASGSGGAPGAGPSNLNDLLGQ